MENVKSSVNSGITFRGEWQTDTIYSVGDYVYLQTRRPGFFYKCTVAGKSQSEKSGKSDIEEPLWLLDKNVYDNVLVWKSIKITQVDTSNIQNWEPNRTYNLGQCVRQQSGQPLIFDEIEIVFQLIDILVKHNWPTIPESRIIDGTVEWECHLSIGYLLPKERLKEKVFYEFVQIMDYLILHEEVYFNDFIHKYNDLTKVRVPSLKEIIAEQGYKYVSDLLNLSEKELANLVKYINIISDLKGSKKGLEVVFNMIGIKYYMCQWWEKNPKGTPHTWDLSIEVEMDKVVSNMIGNLVTFTRNYVYPIIENFEITYSMNMAELAIVMAGFIDIELNTNIDEGFLLSSLGGFVDNELPVSVDKDCSNFIISGGFVDAEYMTDFINNKLPTILRATGVVSKQIIFYAKDKIKLKE